MKKFFLISVVLFSMVLVGCGQKQDVEVVKNPEIIDQKNIVKGKPGALVDINMESVVGVLLDEIPSSMREIVAEKYLNETEDFWKKRAEKQISLTNYRLTYRGDYYEETEGKNQLPLPPQEIWNIEIVGKPERQKTDGHDIVAVKYMLQSTLLTDKDSPGLSEPQLEEIGGEWQEPFVLPIDPILLFQRTGFACMDESQFPPMSVDPEEVSSFYDHECDVEEELSNTACHQTMLPEMSCIDTLKAKTGMIETNVIYKRLPWDDTLADKVRVGEITSESGADLQVYKKEFHENRISYRYIPHDSCALVEKSVGAPGWRRLLQFTTSDINTGAIALNIGPVDYFLEGEESELAQAGVFEFSPCHKHYHFTHYGSFYYGDKATTVKQGFCLQSTQRVSNNELSPTHNPYPVCSYQGVSAGWADQYKAGIENQWVDVTGIDTSKLPATQVLTFRSNPDGFLCEGTPVMDKKGVSVFELTTFKTAGGKNVSRFQCNFIKDWDKNNEDSYNVTIPINGEGLITSSCENGELGPLRDCGFKKAVIQKCTPGEKVTLKCKNKNSPQTVRICETSKVLGTSLPCTYSGPHNAQSLANNIVESEAEISFTCPDRKDEQETGGEYSIYTAPILPDGVSSEIECEQI